MKLHYATWFVFDSQDEISNMSLNGLRRRVATNDKTLTEYEMDEISVALDLGN
jgi:hypothetical protein